MKCLLRLLFWMAACGLNDEWLSNYHSGGQSLKFVVETIENRGKKYFPWRKKSTSILFSMKIKMVDL